MQPRNVPILFVQFGTEATSSLTLFTQGFHEPDIYFALSHSVSCFFQYNMDKAIVDSGTTLLRLPVKVFNAVVDAITRTSLVRQLLSTDMEESHSQAILSLFIFHLYNIYSILHHTPSLSVHMPYTTEVFNL